MLTISQSDDSTHLQVFDKIGYMLKYRGKNKQDGHWIIFISNAKHPTQQCHSITLKIFMVNVTKPTYKSMEKVTKSLCVFMEKVTKLICKTIEKMTKIFVIQNKSVLLHRNKNKEIC